jgi:hypothetical protein
LITLMIVAAVILCAAWVNNRRRDIIAMSVRCFRLTNCVYNDMLNFIICQVNLVVTPYKPIGYPPPPPTESL